MSNLVTRQWRWAAVAAIAALVGAVVGYGVASRNDDMTSVPSSEVSWLFSQTAARATLEGLGDDRFDLTLHDVDVHTIQFSDRPERLVEIIDTSELVAQWGTWFASSAPNAVLVEHEADGTTDSLVVVLETPVFDLATATLSYLATVIADEAHPERLREFGTPHAEPPLEMDAVSLFIDSVVTEESSLGTNVTAPGGPSVKGFAMTPPRGSTSTALSEAITLRASSDGPLKNALLSGNRAQASGQAEIMLPGGLILDVKLEFEDRENWSATLVPEDPRVWTSAEIPGLTLDTSTWSGTLAMVEGDLDTDLNGSTITWQVATGAVLEVSVGLSAQCPLTPTSCPSAGSGPYLVMDGTLAFAALGVGADVSGAVSADATWAQLAASIGNVSLGDVTMTDASVTIWHGERNDAANAAISLPSLASLNDGVDIELCGGFTMDLPRIGNRSTQGCAAWSPQGIVVAQVGVGAQESADLRSGAVSGSTTTNVGGVATTTIPSGVLDGLPSKDAVLNGVVTELATDTLSVTGSFNAPGVVAAALGRGTSPQSLVITAVGTISADELELSGEIPLDLSVGEAPFVVTVRSLTVGVSIDDTAASLSLASSGQATIGTGADASVVNTSADVEVMTAPQVGLTLSLDARGTGSSADADRDGLTAATQLSAPADATYVVEGLFGIDGLNLWDLTVQVGYVDGSPSLAFSSTTYLDPQGGDTSGVIGCGGPCGDDDWMRGSLDVDVSYVNPCIAYSFVSETGDSYLSLLDDFMMTSAFQIGIAPDGCSIDIGGTIESLPLGFAGFRFDTTMGDLPTSLEIATQVSATGFVFETSIDQLEIAGILYTDVDLDISIEGDSTNASFTATMDSGMGDATVDTVLSMSDEGLEQSFEMTLTDWAWAASAGSSSVDLTRLHFVESATIPTTGGCASFSGEADGSAQIGSTTYTLTDASLTIDCEGIEEFELAFDFTHTADHDNTEVTTSFVLEYPYGSEDAVYGSAEFEYKRSLNKDVGGRTFSKKVTIAIGMTITLSSSSPGSSSFEFEASAKADRVDGDLDCVMSTNDFGCSAKVSYNPSWAGKYHVDWDGM